MLDPFSLRLLPVMLCVCLLPLAAQASLRRVDRTIDVAPAWSGTPVGIALLTHGNRQFVAFYDDQRRMTVAARTLDSESWDFIRLPQEIGWDAHNYIALAVDDRGCLHLSGNMHGVPLVYFRTTQPGDIRSFEQVKAMVGRNEERCTYPWFVRGPENELLFTYRSGRAGKGDEIWNIYDPASRTWRRLLDKPLISGAGRMNAYPEGPLRGPDGYFHLCWVWRDTFGCETNHDICYARSRDFVRWETSAGKPLALPITPATAEVADPVPVKHGLMNGNLRIGFDSRKRPVLSYHKFDAKGFTQLFNTRLEDGQWKVYQTSQWEYRWLFAGGGSIENEIRFGPVRLDPEQGCLTQRFSHVKHGSGVWRLDEATLRPTGLVEMTSEWPAELDNVRSTTPGMKVRWCADSGKTTEKGVRYMLRWEALDCNRDKPREHVPPPSMLSVIRLVRNRPVEAVRTITKGEGD